MPVNAPENFDINPSDSSIFISWEASTTPDIVSQELWISTDNFVTSGSNSGSFNDSTPINISPEITSYNLGGLTDGNSYWAGVISKTQTESSSASSASAVPGPDPQLYGVVYYSSGIYNLDLTPSSVENVNIQQISNKRYKLTWTPPTSGQLFDITGYRVWRSENSGPLDIVATVAPSATMEYIDRVELGKSYKWRITVLDEGEG